MPRPAPRTPLLVFGLVALYIVLQSAWWMWLLLSKDRDVYALQQQLIAEGVTPHLPVRTPQHTLWMIAGEGVVFLLLLLLALWLTYRTLRHELALARQQRDFLLASSHELRTPIAGLKLHLQTLQRPDLDAGRREALATNARHEVERLRVLTEKILLATRLDEARMPLDRAAVDVAAEAAGIAALARASYAHGHALLLHAPPTLLLDTDAEAFRSVLENLVENACKYAPAGTTVTIDLADSAEGVRLSVTDEGPGVPPADRARIFEKFYRAGNEETRGTKGTGLGLFIVARLMRALGGRVDHRPAAPHGSIFVATFPQRP